MSITLPSRTTVLVSVLTTAVLAGTLIVSTLPDTGAVPAAPGENATPDVVIAAPQAPAPQREDVAPERAALEPVVRFVDKSAAVDAEGRADAIRQWVLPSRALEFAAAFEGHGARAAANWSDIDVTPVTYRVVRADDDEARIAVFSRVDRTARDGSGTSTVHEVSGWGALKRSGAWWVYAYFGTESDYDPDDPELAEFTPVPSELAS